MLENVLASYTSILTWTLSGIGSVVTTIMGQPMLLIPFACISVGFVIAKLRSLI